MLYTGKARRCRLTGWRGVGRGSSGPRCGSGQGPSRRRFGDGTPVSDRAPEPTAIEIRLNQPQQLFNSLDPSPFYERDLDHDAEEYLVDSADEYPIKHPLRLVIYLPADQIREETPNLAQAIHNYFAYRAEETRRRLRFFFRDGRMSLLAGLIFLFGCIALRQVILAVGHGLVAQIADEGLYIVGWVAMWRPLEIFLYDWRPIRHRERLFEKLAHIPVSVCAS